jgi:hypothetical protein
VSVDVDLVLEPGLASVRPRRPSPSGGGRGSAPERFRGTDRADLVAAAVRGARCLRTLRRVDLRIVLETSEVLLRARPEPTVRRSGDVADGLTVLRVPTGPSGGVLEVAVPSELLTEVAEGVRSRRCWGPARMELGVLARTAAVLRSAGPALGHRPGAVLDVTRAAVTVLELDGVEVVGARAMPATDVRAALAAVLPILRGRLAAVGGPAGADRPWLHLAVPPALASGVRDACAAALPPGSAVDVLRLARGPR